MVEALSNLRLLKVLIIRHWASYIDVLSLRLLLNRRALLEIVIRSVEVFVVNKWHAAYNSSGSDLHRVVNARKHLPLLHLSVAIEYCVTVFLDSMLHEVTLHVTNQMTIETNVGVIAKGLTFDSRLNKRRLVHIVWAHLLLTNWNHLHHVIRLTHAR